jgi:phenylacetate-CoA ligase
MLYKYIYILGRNLRNPSLKKQFQFLKKSEKWTLNQLENYQLKKLKELISFAYENTVYYKDKFNDAHIVPSDIKNLNDIHKIPFLTKSDILKHNKNIHTKHSFKKTFKAATSGSTGNSLVFLREEQADSFNRASINRGYSWYNIKPWDKNGYFWGFNFSATKKLKTKILDQLQNRFRVFSYEKKAFNSFVTKLETATYIHGYSSMIYQTAKLINNKKLQKPKHLKMVKGTSEKIFDKYQEEVKNAFGLKIISEYGATESGIIAFECPEGNMHLNMEGVLVEEIDHEIVVTNLQMQSFPIIRYKLGDYVTLAPRNKKCSCGKNHLIIEEVTGRIGKNIYGKENTYPSLYFYYIFKNLDKNHNLKLNYQILQEKRGYLVFKIESKLTVKEIELLSQEIKKYFKTDVNFNISDNQIIEAKGVKLKSFISKID